MSIGQCDECDDCACFITKGYLVRSVSVPCMESCSGLRDKLDESFLQLFNEVNIPTENLHSFYDCYLNTFLLINSLPYYRFIPTSSIPTLSISTVNSHLVNVDKVGIDEVGRYHYIWLYGITRDHCNGMYILIQSHTKCNIFTQLHDDA